MMLLKNKINFKVNLYNKYKVNKFLDDMRVEYKARFVAYLIETNLYPASEQEGSTDFRDVLDYCVHIPYTVLKDAYDMVYLIVRHERVKAVNPPKPPRVSDNHKLIETSLHNDFAPTRMIIVSRAKNSADGLVVFEKSLDDENFVPVDPREEARILIQYANLLIEKQEQLEAEANGSL